MIKSKFTTFQYLGQFWLTLMLIILLVLFYFAFFGKFPVHVFSAVGIMAVFLGAILPIYIVGQMKLNYKISGRFYANIDELKKGLSSLKYKGFIKYSVPLSFKIAFHQTVL